MARLLIASFLLLLAIAPAAQANQAAFLGSRLESRQTLSAQADQQTTNLESIRSKAGLSPVKVNQDGALSGLLDKYIKALEALPADGPSRSDEPDGLVYCGCYLWQKEGQGFRFISPTEFAASLGQSGSYGAWILESNSLSEIKNEEGAELFLDSRLTDLAFRDYPFPDGSKVVVLFVRLADGPARISASQSSLDAFQATTLAFTSPDNLGKFKIELKAGNSWLTKYSGSEPENFTQTQGFAGLRLNYFADSDEDRDRLRLAWGGQYRISGAGQTGQFTTARPQPPRKSWQFAKSMSSKNRRLFKQAIASMNPRYRAMLKEIAPYTLIATHAGSGASIASPYDWSSGKTSLPFKVSFARGHLMMRGFRKEVIAHELGHIVEFAGIDDQGYREFKKVFKKSKKWRNCSSSNYKPSGGLPHWPCTEDMELIADQIAYGATNHRSGLGGYGHPRLVSAKKMMSLLTKYYHQTSPFQGKLLTDSDWRDLPDEPEEIFTSAANRSEGPIVDTFR